ncbi:hypothetical protein [Nocardioides daphniae]|uniref:DUF4386 family protein n=1 Tax=Nocardioides daphniae TaxID=402297 RepID=A0A4P7UA36_9ACTN|nr:hypothetical protein [Nocardioides daphniae]QCC76494.1 hypothetical protein E2C04_03370 [Nocardioides daphniae]GGD06161.1 hypothetical protein GCM10007231_01100 [Nocardioides daphniae]
MRNEWLAVSAAALVIGATALFFGSHLTPRPTGDGAILRLVHADPDAWTTAAVVLMVASTGLLFGVSSMTPLVRGRGVVPGIVGLLLLAFAAVVLAGFAMQLVLLRALSVEGGVDADSMAAAMRDPLQQGMLKVGFGAFYVGEVMLALAFLRSATTPRWVPALFLLHVAAMAVAVAADIGFLEDLPSILMVAAFVGAAICANRGEIAEQRATRTRRG